HPARERSAGRWRPRVRRRDHPVAGARGPEGDVTERPSARQVVARALVLYAMVRRASIELIVAETRDQMRRRQAESARIETEHWFERESLTGALTDTERSLF